MSSSSNILRRGGLGKVVDDVLTCVFVMVFGGLGGGKFLTIIGDAGRRIGNSLNSVSDVLSEIF